MQSNHSDDTQQFKELDIEKPKSTTTEGLDVNKRTKKKNAKRRARRAAAAEAAAASEDPPCLTAMHSFLDLASAEVASLLREVQEGEAEGLTFGPDGELVESERLERVDARLKHMLEACEQVTGALANRIAPSGESYPNHAELVTLAGGGL